MKEEIWQGTMFEALAHTLRQDGLRAVQPGKTPEDPSCRNFLARDKHGWYKHFDDNGFEDNCVNCGLGSFSARLYRQSPGYELREMTLLAAMAYAQENGLEWMETISGYRHRLAKGGSPVFILPSDPEDSWEAWRQGILDPVPFTWRIPTDSQWVPLTVAEVEALEVQDA
jgi:hypothetical protein